MKTQINKREKEIIAILEMGILKGKTKLPQLMREIQIPIRLPLKASFTDEMTMELLNVSPRLVFEWRHQIGKSTHLFTLKEII